jgi:quercetin dioxygenase-like cupin family protein
MFYKRSESTPIEMAPGLTRRVLATSQSLMLAEFTFEGGAAVPQHSHPHDQVGYVVAGRMEMVIGGRAVICGPGDSYHAPPDVPHSGVALEPSVVIDVFYPPREDYG